MDDFPIHYDYEDLYVAIINNEYDIRPCGKCENGYFYVDGALGIDISSKSYYEMLDDEDSHVYMEGCPHCHATGKIIKIHESEDW